MLASENYMSHLYAQIGYFTKELQLIVFEGVFGDVA